MSGNMGSGSGSGSGSGAVIREQDQYMPIANVIRIMRRMLPSHAKISDDAKETIQECVSEYISFVTGEANDRCQREQRKTVTAEDVLWAMSKLGFDDYVPPLTLFLNRYRNTNNNHNNATTDPYSSVGIFDPMLPGYYIPVGPSSSSGVNNNVGLPGYDPFSQFK